MDKASVFLQASGEISEDGKMGGAVQVESEDEGNVREKVMEWTTGGMFHHIVSSL